MRSGESEFRCRYQGSGTRKKIGEIVTHRLIQPLVSDPNGVVIHYCDTPRIPERGPVGGLHDGRRNDGGGARATSGLALRALGCGLPERYLARRGRASTRLPALRA